MQVEPLEGRCLLSDGLGAGLADHCVIVESTSGDSAEVGSADSPQAIASARGAVARNHENLANFAGAWNVTTALGNGTANLTQTGKKVTGTTTLGIPEVGQLTLNFTASVKKNGKAVGNAQVTVPGQGTIRFAFTVTMVDPPNGNIAAGIYFQGQDYRRADSTGRPVRHESRRVGRDSLANRTRPALRTVPGVRKGGSL